MIVKKNQIIDKEYDVIVVGSGLAGMTAANKLATLDRKVLLLEAHNKLGGFATWFKRSKGDHIFDISLHGFPVGMVKTCRKYWGKEISDKIEQVDRVRYVNPQFEIETDFTIGDFKNILCDKFGAARETVEAFFTYLNEMNFYDDNQMSNRELFHKFFPDRNDIVRFLLEPIVYANGSNLDDPAISYGIVFSNFMSKGVYIYRGGTDEMILKMKDILVRNTVDIKLQTKIEDIVIEDGITKGVMVDGKLIKSKVVLSNANLLNTVFNMAGETNFSADFIKKASEVRLNSSSAQVFMGIKEGETLPDIGELIFCSEDEDFSSEKLLKLNVTSQTFSMYYPKTRPQLNNRYAVVSSSNALYENWKALNEEEYKLQKEKLIETAICGLEKLIPGVRDKIDFVQASTPLSIERYTHHRNGASFGTKFEGLDVSMNMHNEVDGLFHSGSVGIIMSGWLGAANYGVIQSHAVENYLYKLDEKTQESL